LVLKIPFWLIDLKHFQVSLKETIAEFWFAWELVQNYENADI